MLIPPFQLTSNGAAKRAVQVVKQAMRKMGTTTTTTSKISADIPYNAS